MAVEEVFDAVVVATGHYSHPRLPTIKGLLKEIPLPSIVLLRKRMGKRAIDFRRKNL
jgi:hypothetical protein